MTSTKAVVFDLGGVLIDLHSGEASRELIDKFGMRPDRVDALTRSCFTQRRRSITELAMIGKVGTADYLAAFLRGCRTKDAAGIRANRLSVLGRERKDVFAIAGRLQRAGMVCCIFSNTIALHWEKLSSGRDYCASTDYQPVESSGPLVGQGQWGTRKVADGVDIWTMGAPPRKYRVLGVIHDTRPDTPYQVSRYYHDIAGKVKQAGGDAAIKVSSRSEYTGTASFANATTTTSGGFTGTGYRSGNVVDVTGNVNTTSNTYASGMSVPTYRYQGQFLVVRYL